MPYSTPKTTWTVTISNGVYTGDFFNVVDYTRICNNIVYVATVASTLYSITINLTEMASRSVNDVPLASDFNAIETNIQTLCQAIITPSAWTEKKTWYANRPAPVVADWNRWEATILGIKNKLDYDAQWIEFIPDESTSFVDANGLIFQTFRHREGE